MIQSSEKVQDAIYSLIVINNDRYEGYKTAAEEAKDADLKALFLRYSNQSQGFNNELRRLIPNDEDPKDDTTASGKLYRVWMDIKAAMASNDRKAVLASCEFGEDTALGTYTEALEEGELTPEVHEIISRQANEVREAHNYVRSLRDNA